MDNVILPKWGSKPGKRKIWDLGNGDYNKEKGKIQRDYEMQIEKASASQEQITGLRWNIFKEMKLIRYLMCLNTLRVDFNSCSKENRQKKKTMTNISTEPWGEGQNIDRKGKCITAYCMASLWIFLHNQNNINLYWSNWNYNVCNATYSCVWGKGAMKEG